MPKVYMRADENEAGVTVEDDPNGDGIQYEFRDGDYHDVGHVYERQFRPFVEGLLRRMLDKAGTDTERGAYGHERGDGMTEEELTRWRAAFAKPETQFERNLHCVVAEIDRRGTANEKLRETVRKREQETLDACAEADDLRAKLAKAETTLNEYATALGATEAKLAEAEKELEETKSAWFRDQVDKGKTQIKLAEVSAELTAAGIVSDDLRRERDGLYAISRQQKERAETAEARVRELELSIKLIASGNGNIRTEQNR